MEERELPPGWKWENLGELGTWSGGGTPSKANKAFWTNGNIPWISPKDMKFGRIRTAEDWITEEAVRQSSTKHIPENSILMVTRSGILARTFPVAVNECAVTVNQDLKALTPFDCADPDFLTWYLRAKNFRILKECAKHGTTVASIDTDRLKKFSVPIAPLNEQCRIVEKIETLFARLDKGEEALRAVQKLLDRYRQSVLKAAVTGQLTADWRAENAHRLEHGRDLLARILQTRRETWEGRGKYKEPAAPDTTDLPELPEEWVWATLPMLGEFGRGKSKHRPRNDPRLYSEGKYPFLQTGRVRNSAGRISEYDALYSEFGLAQSKIWPKGTICITIAANIAESGILEIDACFPDSVVGLVPHPEVSGEYIECFIRTAKENLDRYAPATAQKNINLEILNAVAVPLPPSEEQAEIRDRIDEAFSTARFAEQACETELARSAALRQSILKDAFAGRLVPQDPADEPAAALLDRIQQTRAAPPNKTRRKVRA